MAQEVLFDYDPLLYACGPLAEERFVKATNIHTGDAYEVANRTAFYGHWKKKQGGLLAKMNEEAIKPLTAEDFTYEDVQEPTNVKWATNALDAMIEKVLEKFGTNQYYGYVGKGKVFRHDLATIVPYKDGRDNALKPLCIDYLKQYLVKQHNAKIIETIEVDDQCTIDSVEAFAAWKKGEREALVTGAVDKDYRCGPIHMYNMNDETYDTIDGFGKLWIQSSVSASGAKKREVKGCGRIWLVHQVLSGDDADTYWANSACPEKPWGEMSSYNLLCNCTTDKEAFEALVQGYKTLYPEPKVITGWRGNEIEVDWLYVAAENWSLAKMLKKPGEFVTLQSVLTKLGIKY
jgi:hypothetical protein